MYSSRFLYPSLLFISCLFFVQGSFAQSILAWTGYNGTSDAFTGLPQGCGIAVSTWQRGTGAVVPTGGTPTQFISRSFGSEDYDRAVDSGDYIYFSIKTDSYTTISISNFNFRAAKSPGADTVDIVVDYGRSSDGFTFSKIDSFRVGATAATGVFYPRTLSPEVIIGPSDSAVFRLVVQNDLGSGLSTFRICNHTGFTATITDSILHGAISVDTNPICYDGTDVPVTISFTGPANGVAYYRGGDSLYTALLDTSGTGAATFYANNANTPVTFTLDSVVAGCHKAPLDITAATVTAGTVSRKHLFGFVCGSDSWSFSAPADSTMPSGAENPAVTYIITIPEAADSVVLQYTFTGSGYCDSILIIHLKRLLPSVTDPLGVTICAGDTFNFGGTLLTTGGLYIDTFVSVSGCDSVASLQLDVLPHSYTAVDTALCFGEYLAWGAMTLTMSGAYTQVFAAANGCDSVVDLQLLIKPAAIRVDQTEQGCGFLIFEGKYYDTSTVFTEEYTDMDGCDSLVRTIHIAVNQISHDTLSKTICRGESYLFNGALLGQEGVYNGSYTGSNGCDSIITLILTVASLPPVSIEQVTYQEEICVNDTIDLVGTGAMVYNWYNDLGPIGNDRRVAAFLPGYENYIMLRGTDENGCSDTASIVVNAGACCELMMPNAFSPNGDGLNDKFGPATYGNPVEYRFQVFDRLGRRVFVSFNAGNKWDGTIDGVPAPLATYFYNLIGKCINGKLIDMAGDFILLR